ncbi:MAG: AarF/ABC1/UbiB kinase family protein, partial [Microvirga sp.]
GAVFLHLKAELNYHRLFEKEIERFSLENLEQKQKEVLAASGLPNPV